MPNTAISLINLAENAGTDVETRTTIVHANTWSIDLNGVHSKKVIFHVLNTTVGAKNIIVNAGDVGAESALGSLTVAVGASTGEKILILSSSRFADSSGKITGTVEANMTGTFAAYVLP